MLFISKKEAFFQMKDIWLFNANSLDADLFLRFLLTKR